MKFASSYEPGEFETDIYAAWEAAKVFRPKMLTAVSDDDGNGVDDRTEGGDDPRTFSIVMPPPNANGNLHIGHGLTIALEDSLTRFYRLNGRSAWYIPGADHAGFETWVVYERTLEKDGHTRFEFSRDELYARVWDFVASQRGNMEVQLRALGASCSWDDLTFTLDENVINRVYSTFEKMWNDGMIYRGEKLVNYCPKHQTAFADIEVEHEDEEGKLWDIAYLYADSTEGENPSSSGRSSRPSSRGSSLRPRSDCGCPSDEDFLPSAPHIVVSTTRPETLFGDVAVAVNPEDKRYKDLIGKMVKLPLTDRLIPVVADEHADMEYGTGAVKITPAHDFDDFEVGERHDLPRIRVIDDGGKMMNCGEGYDGLTTAECRKKVLRDLKEDGLLKGERKISHAVAHCYKCGTTIEPTLKEQWFIDVEKLAAMAIAHLEKDEIAFHPENKKKVLINYLKGLKDWNISRQIPWGIAIPMFRKVSLEATGAPEWVFDRRTNLRTIEIGGVKYERDEDTFDTWFSSSHWPIVCTDWTEENGSPYYPLNVMETGADILFAWVARMIMMGVYVTGEVPFKDVYLHGLVLDEHGKKMSKSKGNVINPMDLVGKYGSDAFRLGILRGRSAGMNQAFSEQSVVAGRNLCNKLWNISRYIQSIVDEDSETGIASSSEYSEEVNETGELSSSGRSSRPSSRGSSLRPRSDCGCPSEDNFSSFASAPGYSTENMGEDWICREINNCVNEVAEDMGNYRFAEAVETLYSTIWDKYADWFIESQKIYRNVPLLKKTLENLLIALHPFAPFVTEAIWQNLSWTEGYIVTQKWSSRLKFDPISAVSFEKLMDIVVEVRGTLQAIPGGKKWGLLYDNDSLVEDNSLLIKKLTNVSSIEACVGAPRGIRLALANHELYLDVPTEVVAEYKAALTERILSVGRELDALNARMMNPRYVDKAPAALVKETRDGIAEKTALIERLKKELEVI